MLTSPEVLQGGDVSSGWVDELTSVVALANYQVVTIDDPWPGEGRNWRTHTGRVLSFTGAGTWFHTAGDTPDQATTPASLGAARDAVWNATQAFVDHVR